MEEEFLHAAEFGDVPTVKRLLSLYSQLNVDCIDALGRTALRLAVKNEHLEVGLCLRVWGVVLGVCCYQRHRRVCHYRDQYQYVCRYREHYLYSVIVVVITFIIITSSSSSSSSSFSSSSSSPSSSAAAAAVAAATTATTAAAAASTSNPPATTNTTTIVTGSCT